MNHFQEQHGDMCREQGFFNESDAQNVWLPILDPTECMESTDSMEMFVLVWLLFCLVICCIRKDWSFMCSRRFYFAEVNFRWKACTKWQAAALFSLYDTHLDILESIFFLCVARYGQWRQEIEIRTLFGGESPINKRILAADRSHEISESNGKLQLSTGDKLVPWRFAQRIKER